MKRYLNYRKRSQNRKKFIIQELIPNLKYDFKVIVINSKVFVLKRYVRKNDFRASGSGNFIFDKNISSSVLDYAYEIFKLFNCPFISLDFAENNNDVFYFNRILIYKFWAKNYTIFTIW